MGRKVRAGPEKPEREAEEARVDGRRPSGGHWGVGIWEAGSPTRMLGKGAASTGDREGSRQETAWVRAALKFRGTESTVGHCPSLYETRPVFL